MNHDTTQSPSRVPTTLRGEIIPEEFVLFTFQSPSTLYNIILYYIHISMRCRFVRNNNNILLLFWIIITMFKSKIIITPVTNFRGAKLVCI